MIMGELERRALTAYFRSGDKTQPSDVTEVSLNNLTYYVLSNANSILAVYRYIVQRDVLKRMKRIPKGLVENEENLDFRGVSNMHLDSKIGV